MDDNSKLDLNTESIHQRTGISSSLTDINQIFVFTDEFENIKNKVDSTSQLEKANLEAKIFEQQMTLEVEDEIIGELFAGKIEKTVVREEKLSSNENSFYLPGCLFLILSALVLSMMMGIKKKEKKRDDVDNQLQTAG